MSCFVLVHGAWGGAHGWRHVRRLLREAGHEVSTPSLTGIGERVHLASPLVNLSTHVRDVVNHVLYEDLQDLVLVGFSYGGCVVAGAMAHIAGRVRHLVLLDAFLPDDGQSVADLVGTPSTAAITLGESWQLAGPARDYDDPAEAAWAGARRSPQPAACFTEPVHLPRPLESLACSRTYIKATGTAADDPRDAAFRRAAERVRRTPGWRYETIDSGHMLPANRPAEVVRLLLDVAST